MELNDLFYIYIFLKKISNLKVYKIENLLIESFIFYLILFNLNINYD